MQGQARTAIERTLEIGASVGLMPPSVLRGQPRNHREVDSRLGTHAVLRIVSGIGSMLFSSTSVYRIKGARAEVAFAPEVPVGVELVHRQVARERGRL